jgi:hypothetical protein
MPIGNFFELFILFAMLCPIILAICLPIIIIRGLKRQKTKQFSLKALLKFVTLCAIWLSQFSTLQFNDHGETFEFCRDFVIIFVWIFLAVFYFYRRFQAPFVIHTIAVALFLIVMFFALAFVDNFQFAEAAWKMSIACFCSSLLSFPFSIFYLWGFMGHSKKDFTDDAAG